LIAYEKAPNDEFVATAVVSEIGTGSLTVVDINLFTLANFWLCNPWGLDKKFFVPELICPVEISGD